MNRQRQQTKQPPIQNGRRDTLLAVAVALMAVAAYWPTTSAEFLPYDDQDYVYRNPHVAAGITPDGVRWAFTESYAANWHPLTWLSHMLDVEIFDLDPGGHHLSATLWHAATTALLFLVLIYMTRQAVPSFLLASIFALHPANVESVAWIAQRKTTVSTFFALLSIGSYAIYVRRSSRAYYVASLVAFAASLMAKQTFVTLPLLLILLDYWPLRRNELSSDPPTISSILISMLQNLRDKLPYLFLAGAAAAITLIAQDKAIQSLDHYPLTLRIGNVLIAYVRYLLSIVWPMGLAIFYPMRLEAITIPKVLASTAFLLATTAIAIWFGRTRRYLLVGWLWFLISMVPMVGIVHVGGHSMADRYLYAAQWGILIALIWLAWDGVQAVSQTRTPAWIVIPAAALVLAPLAARTFLRAQNWQTAVSVFEEAAQNAAPNWLAHQILGLKAVEAEDFQSAKEHAEISLTARPDALTYVIDAAASRGLGDRQAAIARIQKAIELDPDMAFAFSQIALNYAEQNKQEKAIEYVRLAQEKLQLPVNQAAIQRPALVYRDCGNVLMRANRVAQALEQFQNAMLHEPRNNLILQDAAKAYLKQNRLDLAIEQLQQSIQLQPDDPNAHSLLGSALARQGKLAEAATSLKRAIDLNSTDISARLQRAHLLIQLGQSDQADRLIDETLPMLEPARENPTTTVESRADNHVLLGDIQLARRDIRGAIEQYRLALAVWPDHFAANNNLAWLLATHADPSRRDPQGAIALAEHAANLRQQQDYASLGTLAAAYAAANRLDDAVRTVRTALARAHDAGDAAAARQLQQQLQQHIDARPIIEPATLQPDHSGNTGS